MAKLKKYYWSVTQEKFLEILNLNNTIDIGTTVNSETLRLVRYNAPVESLNLLNAVKDLLYNDIKMNLEISQISKALSNGVFKNIGNEFELQETIFSPFIKKIRVRSGQIKIGDAVIYTDDVLNQLPLKGDCILGSDIITGMTDTTVLKAGMSLTHPSFPISATVREILGLTSVKISVPAISSATDQDFQFKNDRSYELLNITLSGRTALGSPNVTDINTTGDLYVGMTVISPQFPADVKIISITDDHNIVLSQNASISSLTASLQCSNFIENEGYWRRDTIQINDLGEVSFILGNENSQIPASDTQDSAVSSSHYVLASVLVKKQGGQTFISSYEKIWEYTGLVSSVLAYTKAELEKNWNGFYDIEIQGNVHLTDSLGQRLPWEAGQSQSVDAVSLASGYTEDISAPESIKYYDRTQLPQTFDSLNSASLVNIPFKITNIQNIFGNLSSVPLKKVILGMRTSAEDYGNEGIEIQISTADPVLAVSEPISAFSQSGNLSSITFSLIDFNVPIDSYTVIPGDFILVTDGDGRYQTGKIISVTAHVLNVTGLTKPLTSALIGKSKVQIFKNSSVSVLTNSSVFIDNIQLVSQILSGENGRFGLANGWTKVALKYTVPPTALQDKWYFLQVKGYNVNPPQWGNLPYITIENPIPQLNDNKTKNAYFRINYALLSGIYPNGDFLIEDEFGDINIDKEERLNAPHFRPKRYDIIANDLSDETQYSQFQSVMKESDVFADVKHGRILFKNGYEPRRTYVTYRKINVLNGDSASSDMRYAKPNEAFHTAVQNKLTENDMRFKKGTSFEEQISTNGIKQTDIALGYKGTATAYENMMILKDSQNFFETDISKKRVRLNRSFISDIADVSEKNVWLKDTVFRKGFLSDIAMSNSFVRSVPFLNTDSNDILTAPLKENLKEPFAFAVKKMNDDSVRAHEFDRLPSDDSCSGEYDVFKIHSLLRQDIIHAMLRKNTADILFGGDPYPAEAKHLKTKNMIWDGVSKTLNEEFFSETRHFNSLEFDGRKLIMPYAEKENFRQLKTSKNIDAYSLVGINPQDFSCSSHEGYFVFSYFSLTDSLVHKLYKVNLNSVQDKEIQSISQIGTDHIGTDVLQKIKLKTVMNESRVISIYTCLNAGNFEKYMSIFSYDKNGLVPIFENRLVSSSVYLDNYFDILNIETKTVIAWKKSPTETVSVIYDEETDSFTSENLFTNENIYKDIRLLRITDELYGILTGSSGSLKLRLYTISQNIQFFGYSGVFYQISSSVIPNTFDSDMIRLDSGDIAVVYSETSGSNIDTYLCLISDFFSMTSDPKKAAVLIESVAAASRISDVRLSRVSDSLLAVSYKKAGTHRIRLFQNSLLESVPSSFADQNTAPYNTRTDIRYVKASYLSGFSVFRQGSSVLLDSFEYAPDFSVIHKELSSLQYNTSADVREIRTVRTDSYLCSIVNDSGTSVKLSIFDLSSGIESPALMNVVPFTVSSGTVSGISAVFLRSETGKEIISISFTDSGIVKFQSVNVLGGTPVLLGSALTVGNGDSSRLIKESSQEIRVLYIGTLSNLSCARIDMSNASVPDLLNIFTAISENVNEFSVTDRKDSSHQIYFRNINVLKSINAVFSGNTHTLSTVNTLQSDCSKLSYDSCIVKTEGEIVSYKTVGGSHKTLLTNGTAVLSTVSGDSSVLYVSVTCVRDDSEYVTVIYRKGTSVLIRPILIQNQILALKNTAVNIISSVSGNFFSLFRYDETVNAISVNTSSECSLHMTDILFNSYRIPLVSGTKKYFGNSVRAVIYDSKTGKSIVREIFRDDSLNSFDVMSVSVIRTKWNEFACVWHDARNKIFMRKFIFSGGEVLSSSEETVIKTGFTVLKNIRLEAYNADQGFICIYENPDITDSDFIKKTVFDFFGAELISSDLEINMIPMNIKTLTWISGTEFEVIMNEKTDMTGFKNLMKFDITGDPSPQSFNSSGKAYTVTSLDIPLKKFRFSHSLFSGALFNRIDIGELKLYDWNFTLLNVRKKDSGTVSVLLLENTFKNLCFNILKGTDIIHMGTQFKKELGEGILSTVQDSYGIAYILYRLNGQNRLLQTGPEGSLVADLITVGKNSFDSSDTDFSDTMNRRKLESRIGNEEEMIIASGEEMIIADASCILRLETADDMNDSIELFHIRGSSDFEELRMKLNTKFSITDVINKIYISMNFGKVYIKNNFASSIRLKSVRKYA